MNPFIKKYFFTGLWIILLAVLLFVPGAKVTLLKTFIGSGIFNASAKKEQAVIKAGTFKPLSFIDAKGIRINTGDLRGRIIFLNFWATWCPPCIAEMGSVNALYNKLKDDPRFIFILADTDNDLTQSLSFMEKNSYNLPVYQVASPIPENLFTGTIPTTLIIDASGDIVQRHEGIANYNTEAMAVFLKGL